jgi:hypothetical protein
LRRLRITAPAQLTLGSADLAVSPVERWLTLPTEAKEAVVRILARMITAGVIDTDEEVGGDDAHR